MTCLFKFLLLFLITVKSSAQTSFELQNNSGGTYTMNMYYGADAVIKGIPYEKIKGSPFLFENWMSASLYDYSYQFICRLPIMMNMATGEIYFKDSNGIKVADKEFVRKVVVYTSSETNEVKAVFLNFIPYVYLKGEKINDYLQVLHNGYAILLKYRKKELSISEGGGGMPKYYYFKDVVSYYIQINQKTEKISRLSKAQIFQLLPGANSFEPWLIENNLNLNKEEDVIRFIEYYNSKKVNSNN